MLNKRDRILQYQPLWQGWIIEAFLGEGSYGRVYRAVRRDRAGKYRSAVKLISIPNSPAEYQQVCQAGMDSGPLRGVCRARHCQVYAPMESNSTIATLATVGNCIQ